MVVARDRPPIATGSVTCDRQSDADEVTVTRMFERDANELEAFELSCTATSLDAITCRRVFGTDFETFVGTHPAAALVDLGAEWLPFDMHGEEEIVDGEADDPAG